MIYSPYFWQKKIWDKGDNGFCHSDTIINTILNAREGGMETKDIYFLFEEERGNTWTPYRL